MPPARHGDQAWGVWAGGGALSPRDFTDAELDELRLQVAAWAAECER